MSNDERELRFFRLHCKVDELVREGKRDPREVADVLQVVQDNEAFHKRFFPSPAVTAITLGTAEEQLGRLRPLYRELFNFDFNPEEVHVPACREGFDRLIVANEADLRPNRIVLGLRKRMKVWTYTDNLDAVVSCASYIRRPKGTYAVWVRESQEADEDTRGRSAQDLERESVNCLMLEERLLYEPIYFAEIGKHLDIRSWTRCAGSRDSGGDVPFVYWGSLFGEVSVYWSGPGRRGGLIRARLAVS